MWLLHFLPDSFLQFIVHAILIAGVVGTFLSFFVINKILMAFPPFASYYKAAQAISIVLLVAGIYFEGGYATEMQWRARVAELEKNVADLQRLLEKSKEKKSVEDNFGLGGFAPAIVALTLIALTGLLLWGFARNARRSELTSFQDPESSTGHAPQKPSPGNFEMPERAKALFAGIDLDLSKSPADVPKVPSAPIPNPLADTLRVKLNLARAYITIEDFASAKKSLEEVLRVSNSVDPTITIEAQGLLAELSHRNA